jgi:hypothetical protein
VTDHPRHPHDPLEDFHLANDRQANELARRGRGGTETEQEEASRSVQKWISEIGGRMKIVTGKQPRPRRILLYGQHGVGKSTWASEAPSPIFLNIEDGLNDINCARTEKLHSYGDVVSAVSWLVTNGEEYKTVVVDTLDWLERLIFAEVAREANKTTISDIGYGKGYDAAVKKWEFLLNGLEANRQKGRGIILLAHARIVRFENPETSAYDRYELDLHKSSNGMLQEWCDEVLFASFRVFTRNEDMGFGKERKIALGGKERYIRTNESAAAVAKNRLRLPDELPMSWAEYAKHLAPAANVQGVVSEGSSKKGAA